MTFMSLATLVLAACGFSPVYGTLGQGQSAAAEAYLSQVSIDNIPDREGQYLRNALIDRFYRASRPADPLYRLTVRPIQETRTELDITETSDTTRAQLRLTTTMTLRDLRSGEAVLSRNLHTIVSYNILASEFSTRVSEQNARDNALDDLARQIEAQLGLYFNR